MGEVTQLIAKAQQGDRASLDRLFELLYPELRRIAHRRLSRDRRDEALQTTALVNECYLKFAQREALSPSDRAHFLAYAATVMRSVVVDAARSARTDRRGGDVQHVTLDTAMGDSLAAAAEELLDVDAVLEELQRIDARLVRVVEMRYFAGMTDVEIAGGPGRHRSHGAPRLGKGADAAGRFDAQQLTDAAGRGAAAPLFETTRHRDVRIRPAGAYGVRRVRQRMLTVR